jgi:hypothetical protein
MYLSKLTAIHDFDLFGRLAGCAAKALDCMDNIHTLNHAAENNCIK